MGLNCSAGVKIDARALCVFLPRDLAIGPVDKEYKGGLVISIANGRRGEKDPKKIKTDCFGAHQAS